MRVILDTNVFVSGVFFGGVPARILEAWRDGRIHPVLSAEILDEYRRVGATLGKRYPGVDLEPLLAILAVVRSLKLLPSRNPCPSTRTTTSSWPVRSLQA